jgi:hypothetical protein
VWNVNTAMGFPKGLDEYQFPVIVFHYSVVGNGRCWLKTQFSDYIDSCRNSYKIAFFQDEYHYCRHRFAFIDRYSIDCVYTLLEPQYFKEVYEKYTSVKKLVYHIPGYVGDQLLEAAEAFAKPESAREIDVGYRGRELLPYMGKGAREKTYIAEEFRRRAKDAGLKLDIETNEGKRIYGDNWYKFVANCKAVLGVEAGVSIFDPEDIVRETYEELIARNPATTFDELSEALFNEYEDNIYYRTISPRHFEAAAFRVCQILFEGKYSGAMQPMVHYIPLKKDFSNFDTVIDMFRNDDLRHELTENAHRDLIASGRYSYRNFMRGFDAELRSVGVEREISESEANRVSETLESGGGLRKAVAFTKSFVFHLRFPGRDLVASVGRPLWKLYQKRATKSDLYVWNSRNSKTQ